MLILKVVGFKSLRTTAVRDGYRPGLDDNLGDMLRQHGVVGKFKSFTRRCVARQSRPSAT